MDLSSDAARPRRRDYEKILSTLETRWKRRPTDRTKIMQDIVDGLWEMFADKVISWCGFYLVTSDGQPSILGPHQDKTAVSAGTKDICKNAVAERKTQIVPQERIGNDPAVRPEIVIPIIDLHGNTFAVLDICSAHEVAFGEEDRRWLERLIRILSQTHTERQS